MRRTYQVRRTYPEVTRLRTQMMQVEPHAHAGVRLEPPSGDANLIAQGQTLARTIQKALAAVEPITTLDETMRSLRGRSWSS